MVCSVNELGGRGEAGTNYRGMEVQQGGPWAHLDCTFAHVFVFLGSVTSCWLYKLTLSDQAQVTSATESHSF